MVATKTNERPGTRARASYVRSSAYKAREVLDLIRGKSCVEAHDILAFCERDVARPIAKVLDSAVSNAEHNDGLDADELYVAACYADEGPTLKRWRPRARGRATRIRKRTCHITVIVSRYEAEALERMRARLSRQSAAGAAEARRRRVARSRAAAAQQAGSDSEPDVESQAAAVVQATEAAMSSGDDTDAGGAADSSDEANASLGAAAGDDVNAPDDAAAADDANAASDADTESGKADGSS